VTALLVVGIVLAVLLALALLRLGAEVRYDESGLKVFVRIGPVRLTAVGKDKEPKEKKKKKKEDREKPEKERKKGGAVSAVREALPHIREALGRLRRRLRLDRLEIFYTAAGEDPARVALQCGAGNALAGTLLSLLENAFRLKRREVRVEADFEAERPTVWIDLKLTLAVWELLYAAAALLPLLKLLRRKDKQEKTKTGEAAGESEARQ